MRLKLERYYRQYNKRSYVHPDPLEFLYNYKTKEDIEIAGLIASCLAFGRVSQILKNVSIVLDTLGTSPEAFLKSNSNHTIANLFKGFKYRFVGDKQITALLCTIKLLLAEYGTIENCFNQGVSPSDPTLINGLHFFDTCIRSVSGNDTGYLFANPLKGSGCKRINLFLRWMVRKDEIDPGIWESIPPSKLIVPVDTHMHKIGIKLGLIF